MGTASMLHLEAGLEEVGTTENTDRHGPAAPIQPGLAVGQAQVLPQRGTRDVGEVTRSVGGGFISGG